MRQGNEKLAIDPRLETADWGTPFAYVSPLVDLVRFAAIATQVKFADGDIRGGVALLIDQLRFSENISHGTMLHYIASFSARRGVWDQIGRYANQLSVADAEALLLAIEKGEHRLNRVEVAFDVEYRMARRFLRSFFTSDEPLFELLIGGERSAAYYRELQKLSAADQERALAWMEDGLRKRRDADLARFRRPLRELASTVEPPLDDRPEPSSLSEAAVMAARSLLMENDDTRWLAVSRITPQLARLTLKVVLYRHLHNRLPQDLAVTFGELAQDPLTGATFGYEARPDLTFRVFSKGTPQTGEIGIGVRRQRSGEAAVGSRRP